MDTVFSSGRASPESKQCMSNDDGAEHKLLRCERRKMNYLHRRTAIPVSVPRLTRDSDEILYGQKQKNSIYLQQWFIQTYASKQREREGRVCLHGEALYSLKQLRQTRLHDENTTNDDPRVSATQWHRNPFPCSNKKQQSLTDGPEKRRLTHHISTRPVYRVSHETYPVSLPFIFLNNSVKTDFKKK